MSKCLIESNEDKSPKPASAAAVAAAFAPVKPAAVNCAAVNAALELTMSLPSIAPRNFFATTDAIESAALAALYIDVAASRSDGEDDEDTALLLVPPPPAAIAVFIVVDVNDPPKVPPMLPPCNPLPPPPLTTPVSEWLFALPVLEEDEEDEEAVEVVTPKVSAFKSANPETSRARAVARTEASLSRGTETSPL